MLLECIANVIPIINKLSGYINLNLVLFCFFAVAFYGRSENVLELTVSVPLRLAWRAWRIL